MQAEFCTQINVGEWSISGNLDRVVAQGAEGCGKVRVVGFKVVKFGNVYQEVSLHVFILWGPDPFSAFVDDRILVWVVVGGGARQGSEEVGEEVGFWEDGETRDAARGSGQGGRRDYGNGGNNDGRQEVLDWDVSEWDVLNYFLKALMDICILWLGVGVLELRTREIILFGSNVGENFKKIGRGGDEDRRDGGDGDDRR